MIPLGSRPVTPHFGKAAAPDAGAEEIRQALDLAKPDNLLQSGVHRSRVGLCTQDLGGLEKQLLI
jgi:hypothetical protein